MSMQNKPTEGKAKDRSSQDRAAWTVDRLLSARRGAVAMIDDIDAELRRRGVRPIQNVVGRPREVAEIITRTVSDGPRTTAEIHAAVGLDTNLHAVQQMLSKMTLMGELRRVSRGVYGLPLGAGGGR